MVPDSGGQGEVRQLSVIGTRAMLKGAKPVRLCPCSSDVNLFSYGEGIVDFTSEIPDGALDLRMSQQQLYGRQVAGSTIDERRFGASQRVRGEKVRVGPIAASQFETSRAYCRVVMQRL
jgi:hypothetical protein